MRDPKCINEVITGRGGNYIMPFLWMHGEGKEIILDELDQIGDCGIREVCVESRPHPDFMGDLWWEEMDALMAAAKEKNMRIWLLDDSHFPTGYGNGVYQTNKEKAKVYLKEAHMDICGPGEEIAITVEPFLRDAEELLGIWLYERPDLGNRALSGERYREVTGELEDGMVYLSVPEGSYRLMVLYTTREGGGRCHYMNPIDEESVSLFLDTVYEPHFERYQAEFGTTFAGFFSDEPELGNTPEYHFEERLGTANIALPWSRQLRQRLEELWGPEYAGFLPALWYDMGARTGEIRWTYMEQVTLLVKYCFSCQIGQWCAEHGVEYIGHLIEDDNAHGRTGCSLGHYFRAQEGQNMSGIDVVLTQIFPGFTGTIHQWAASDRDGEFFHFGLGKLGSSGACLDPKKAGRAMCEIFGAYGWGEGVSLMKWLTDHMLVRGINEFVPHAFSPAFPDEDCPPHFYARGNNPQYPFFKQLMGYMNRMSHLFHGGTRRRQAAVLYHADSEWGGEAMCFQKPVRELLEHQMDCDVVPADLLISVPEFHDHELHINGNRYRVFIIPACSRLPIQAAGFLEQAYRNRIPVFMVDRLPECMTDGTALPQEAKMWMRVVPLHELATAAEAVSEPFVCLNRTEKDLRVCCYDRTDTTIYFFFNENSYRRLEADIRIPFLQGKQFRIYEGMKNCIQNVNEDEALREYAPVTCLNGETNLIHLCLRPGEAACCFTVEEGEETLKNELASAAPGSLKLRKQISVDTDWKVSKAVYGNGADFEPCLEIKAGGRLPNLNGKGYFPRFCGTFRYEGSFCLEEEAEKMEKIILELPDISECARISVNGRYAGDLLTNFHYLDISEYLRKGVNYLMIEVTNTLVWNRHDERSVWMQLPPTGMRRPPLLHCYGR